MDLRNINYQSDNSYTYLYGSSRLDCLVQECGISIANALDILQPALSYQSAILAPDYLLLMRPYLSCMNGTILVQKYSAYPGSPVSK